MVPLESDDLETFCYIEEGTNLEKCEISCNSPTKKAKGLKRSFVQVLKNAEFKKQKKIYFHVSFSADVILHQTDKNAFGVKVVDERRQILRKSNATTKSRENSKQTKDMLVKKRQRVLISKTKFFIGCNYK